MGKFFENLGSVLIAGLVLAILIAVFPDSGYGNSVGAGNLWLGLFQWLHVFFGITWIGLLYYFNFVQIPTMWICYKVMELRVVGRRALEEAARESEEKKKLEARLAVLERIVTDRGIQTAEQIDALLERQPTRIES